MVAALVGAGLALYQMVAACGCGRSASPRSCTSAWRSAGRRRAGLMQRFVIAPNEQARETPYIEHNIAATRKAFALDRVEEREVSGDSPLTRADIDANAETLGNVRLWDHQPLLQTFAQIQEIRTYYDFVSVHNDRYRIDGQYRQIMLSARELNSDSLPNRNWINERLTFTHGYGVTLGPVNQVTPEGPAGAVHQGPAAAVDGRPEDRRAVDLLRPALERSRLRQDARARIPLPERRGQRLHVLRRDGRRADFEPLPPRALQHPLPILQGAAQRGHHQREPRDVLPAAVGARRAYRAVPALRRGSVSGHLERPPGLGAGRRTRSAADIPYSTPAANGINYIRNSVKATVDAFHGTVRFYLIDETDPIALTLKQRVPGPVPAARRDARGHADAAALPGGHLRAAGGGVRHLPHDQPAVFYNKEDLWEVPAIDGDARAQLMQPYYTIMRLPGERQAEFIQMLPFTPARKDNLASWMVARSDGEHYGRMMVFQFPKQKVVFGPRQMVARINQDQVISPQITLWNQQGSEVLQGTLLVIPIEESLIYIRPLYLRSAGGRIPELKRVIVAYQNQIVMEETLDAALNRMFPKGGGRTVGAGTPPAGAPPSPLTPSPESSDELSSRALESYQRRAPGAARRQLGALR